MSERAPAWMSKHPCSGCGTGYGECSTGLRHNLMCCKDCEHPTRWASNPWTSAEYREMWEGKEMPKMVKDALQSILAQEAAAAECVDDTPNAQ